MTWRAVAVPTEEVTPEFLYNLGTSHRLVPESLVDAIEYYKAICPLCRVIEVKDGDEDIATLVLSSIADGSSADVDFIPMPQHFSYGKPYAEGMKESMVPVFKRLLEGRNLRRLTAQIPKSRSRTCKALTACGFKKEGVMRDAIKLRGREVEDIVIMGLLPRYLAGDKEQS